MRLTIIFFCLGILITVTSAVRCPGKDWVYRKGTNKCYHIISKTDTSPQNGPSPSIKSFKDAVQDCRIRGGKIVTFDDAEELKWIKAKLDASTWYWVGLTFENGKWEWTDGETFWTFTNNTIPGFTIPAFPTYTTSATERATKRISLYNSYDSNDFTPRIESSTTSNRWICKGDFSGRPWCDVENGWRYHDGRCIRYYPQLAAFDAAESLCQGVGGRLTVPTTLAEDEIYKAWLRDSMKVSRAWVGVVIDNMTPLTKPEDVSWFDGTPITATNYSIWPDTNLTKYFGSLPYGQKLCGELYTLRSSWSSLSGSTAAAHQWVLRNMCSEAKPFACETPLSKCPYGWREYGDQCYQFNMGEDRLRTWNEARTDCKNQAGDLVVIQKYDQEQFYAGGIVTLMNYSQAVHDYIINAAKVIFEPWQQTKFHYWIGLKGSGQSYTWVNATQPLASSAYTSWAGNSAPVMSGESCVYFNGDMMWYTAGSGDWNATLCSQKMGYICEAPYTANIPSPEEIFPSHECAAPFEKYHDGCYLQVRQKKNRDDAQRHCIEQKSNLAYLVTFGENLWLQAKATEDSWLGVRIIGKSDDGKKWNYQYSDDNMMGPGAFTRWDDSGSVTAQNDPNFNKFCVAIAGANSSWVISSSSFYSSKARRGYWYHVPCNETREFFCYHPGQPVVRPPTDTFFDLRCGAGWFSEGDNCYQIHHDPVPWRLAKQVCQNLHPDSDLLTITTKEENRFIDNLMNNNLTIDEDVWMGGQPSTTNYWLGLYSEKNNDWNWPSRSSSNKWHIPLAVSNWAGSEPLTNTLTAGKPRCAHIRTSTWGYPKWYSADCGESHPYMCKRVIPPVTAVTPTPGPTALPGQEMGCPKDWALWFGRCVKYSLSTLSWSEAQSDCRTQKAELVTIKTQAEFDEQKRFSNSWTGLNSLATQNGPRVFVWASGAPVTFLPWDGLSFSSSAGGPNSNCAALTMNGIAVYPCAQKKSYTCEMPLQSVVPVGGSDGTHTVPGCQPGAYGFRESCYFFGNLPSSNSREFYNFDNADYFCVGMSGRLVVVDDVDEQRFLDSHVSRFGTEFWIGMKKGTEWEAYLKWITGETVKFTNWGPSQPGSVDGAGCVGLSGTYTDYSLPGDWYVDRCSERKYALCETKRTITFPPTPPPVVTPKPTGCPSGWKTKDTLTSCYKGYVGEELQNGVVYALTWQAAEDFCRGFQTGHLVSIASAEEQNFVDFQVQPFFSTQNQYWIGLRETPYQSEKRWTWSDNSPLTVDHFHIEEDHSQMEEFSCAALESLSGDWIPQNCQQSYGWMCEIQKGAYSEGTLLEEFPSASPINTTCGESSELGEWYFDETVQECIYFSKHPNDWVSARQDCRRLDSRLVTIMDKSHHDWIAMKSSQISGADGEFYWIGLYQTDQANRQFGWDDGHVSMFRAWEAGQPNPHGRDRCVAQNTKSGLWRDLNCGLAYPYICAKSSRTRPPELPTRAPDVGNCPKDWVQHQSSCYYFATEAEQNTTWEEALNFCSKQTLPGADLVSIHGQSENDFILAQMKHRHHIGSFWTGLHELSDSWDFGWSDNTPLRYLNWHYNEPYYLSSSEKMCVEYLPTKRGGGRWRAARCIEKRPFICKAGKDPAAQPQVPASTKCQPGYTDFDGNCFVILELEEGKDTWNDARAKCQNHGDKYGDLASISDIYENALVHSMLSEHWRRHNHTFHGWIGMKEHFGHFSWENTCPVVFSNFMSMTLKPTPNGCVSVGPEGKWDDRDCDTKGRSGYAVCERRFTPCLPVHQQSEYDYCPLNFPSECTRSCYRIDVPMAQHDVSPRYVSFQDAKAQCEALDGNLASIRTEDDQKCLERYLENANYNSWIGMEEAVNAFGQPVWQWVGGNVEEDGEPFFNWGINQPANSTSQNFRKACGQIMPNGTWANYECGTYYGRGFICESRKVRRSTPRRTTVLPPSYGVRGGDGLSGGQTAGIVIGVLIAVGLIGGVVFMVKTGRTDSVISSVRSAGTSVRNATTSKFSAAGFTNKNYEKHEDLQKPEGNGNRVDSYS